MREGRHEQYCIQNLKSVLMIFNRSNACNWYRSCCAFCIKVRLFKLPLLCKVSHVQIVHIAFVPLSIPRDRVTKQTMDSTPKRPQQYFITSYFYFYAHRAIVLEPLYLSGKASLTTDTGEMVPAFSYLECVRACPA